MRTKFYATHKGETQRRDSPNMIETCRCDSFEIILRDPRLPVGLQDVQHCSVVEILAHCELVNDVGIVRVDEDTGRDPWLSR